MIDLEIEGRKVSLVPATLTQVQKATDPIAFAALMDVKLSEPWPPESMVAWEFFEELLQDEANIGWGPWWVQVEGVVAGSIGFGGKAEEGGVLMGFDINQPFNFVTSDCIKAMAEWAFEDATVGYIEVHTEDDPKAAKTVCKAGFHPEGTDEDGHAHYTMTRADLAN
ncbi:MAG: GNAT family protein [Armatimonadota bacterium]